MLESFTALLPASILTVAALICFLGGTTRCSKLVWGPFSLLSLGIAAVCLSAMPQLLAEGHLTAEHPVVVIYDPLARIFQFLALIIGTLFAGMAFRQQADDDSAPEFYGLLLTLISGLMVVASANDLILLFLGLELISIPTYILIYLGKRDSRCQEAAAKYFLLSILSAAVLLYGLSFLYGMTGSTNMTTIRNVLQQTYGVANGVQQAASVSKLGIIALVLIFAGLGFKLAAVPFHFYAPDVYQGTNSWNAGLLSIVPKAAGLIALIRILSHTMVGYEGYGQTVALILALVTMTAGNVLALLQTNVRRMLAYSGVAHAGYMLIGVLAAQKAEGWASLLYYVTTYALTAVGAFAVVGVVQARSGDDQLASFAGLSRRSPLLAVCLMVFLLSMAGIPPLAGFFGKFYLFKAALFETGPAQNTTLLWLVVLAIAMSAVSLYYYLQVLKQVFVMDPPRGEPAVSADAATSWVVGLSAVVVVVLGCWPDWLLSRLAAAITAAGF